MTPALTSVTINSSPGDQAYPHVSGDWAAYSAGTVIRYYTPPECGLPDQRGDRCGDGNALTHPFDIVTVPTRAGSAEFLERTVARVCR